MGKEINHNEEIKENLYKIIKEGILVPSLHSFESNFKLPNYVGEQIYNAVGDSLNKIEEQNTRLIKRNKELEELFGKFKQLEKDIDQGTSK